MMTAKRDWQKDWEMCQKATPEPWEYDGMHNEIVTPREDNYWLIISECRSAPDQEYQCDKFGHQYDANFAFIAEARQALPYWLQRVRELEEENERITRANHKYREMYHKESAKGRELEAEVKELHNALDWALTELRAMPLAKILTEEGLNEFRAKARWADEVFMKYGRTEG